MKILFIGDVIGKPGRRLLAGRLPELLRHHGPDYVVVNGENLAHGAGMTSKIHDEMLSMGVDVITSGNHVWDRKEVYQIFERKEHRLVRPWNYPPGTPGPAFIVVEKDDSPPLMVANLLGRVNLLECDCPFRALDAIVEQKEKEGLLHCLVDFHAETTSEKIALGWYAAGRVCALIGTHTHVPTMDEWILPGGTAYCTDAGMCGSMDSILGMEKENILRKFLSLRPTRFEPASTPPFALDYLLIEADDETGAATAVTHERLTVETFEP